MTIKNNFDEFNNNAQKLIISINDKIKNLNDSEKILYARNYINKDILNSKILVGYISAEIKTILNSVTSELYFSIDNMIKNKLMHPEVTNEDYKKIPKIIKNPSKYFKSKSGYDVILFKEDEKFYKLVIKTTQNKKDSFDYVGLLHHCRLLARLQDLPYQNYLLTL